MLYLHEQCDPKIIHRDVKAANILLDDYCEAVVGDFGLAKLLDHRDSHVTTAVRGTVGHIAPEYLSTGQSSEKTDVFGFGILLLELISGQRALEFGKAANQKGAMLDWVSLTNRICFLLSFLLICLLLCLNPPNVPLFCYSHCKNKIVLDPSKVEIFAFAHCYFVLVPIILGWVHIKLVFVICEQYCFQFLTCDIDLIL